MNLQGVLIATLIGFTAAASASAQNFAFTTEVHGATSAGYRVALDSGDDAVIDLHATASLESLRLLGLIDLDIWIDRGLFQHHDVDLAVNLNATFSRNSLGADSAIDGFVTKGNAFSPGDPFAASLDPNFNRSDVGQMMRGGGWYHADIFVGRFVMAATDVAGNQVVATGTLACNRGQPGIGFELSSAVVDMAGSVPPGPVAAIGPVSIGPFRNRRR